MNHTTNYQLNQWELHDRVMMQDFNADNAKIDAALAAHNETLGEHTAKLPKLGNCQIYATTYTGDGQYGEEHPNTLTFPKKPILVVIGLHDRDMLHIFPRDITYNYSLGTSGASQRSVCITWNGSTVSWYSNNVSSQLNVNTKIYHVIAFYPMD